MQLTNSMHQQNGVQHETAQNSQRMQQQRETRK
jgi:hypothetical protein